MNINEGYRVYSAAATVVWGVRAAANAASAAASTAADAVASTAIWQHYRPQQ